MQQTAPGNVAWNELLQQALKDALANILKSHPQSQASTLSSWRQYSSGAAWPLPKLRSTLFLIVDVESAQYAGVVQHVRPAACAPRHSSYSVRICGL